MLINGDNGSTISAFDRGLQYGDGLFETIAVVDSRPCLWDRHYLRLKHGSVRLGIEIPEAETLFKEVIREIGSNDKGVIKIIVTRGEGGRGYAPDPNITCNRVISFSPWPLWPDYVYSSGVSVRICSTRLGQNRVLAGIKHLNRLEQVMARREWNDPDISEGLMLDSSGNVIEGVMSNVFMFKDGLLSTPDLSFCGVEGVVRGLVLDIAKEHGVPVEIRSIELNELAEADAVFLTNSLIGVWQVRKLADTEFSHSDSLNTLIAEVTKQVYV